MAILISILMSLGLVSSPNANHTFTSTNNPSSIDAANCHNTLGWDWTNHQ